MATRYQSHRLTPEGEERVGEIKALAEELAQKLDQVPGRHASIALTHLETAVMFGVRAVVERHPLKAQVVVEAE